MTRAFAVLALAALPFVALSVAVDAYQAHVAAELPARPLVDASVKASALWLATEGKPRLSMRLSKEFLVNPADVDVTVKLEGQLGDEWLCPLISWKQYIHEGETTWEADGSSHGFSQPCPNVVPDRTFQWTTHVYQQADIVMRLEPQGKGKPLVVRQTVQFGRRG